MADYDISFKELITRNFVQVLPWLLPGVEAPEILQFPSELPATLRRVDLMIRARKRRGHLLDEVLAIFECQCQRDPELPETMHLRAALANFLHKLPVVTFLLAFTREAVVPADYRYGFSDDGDLRHRVIVRRIFEEPAEEALGLGIDALLPLVPVMRPRDGDRAALLDVALTRIAELPVTPERRNALLDWATTFATLHLPSEQVTSILKTVQERKSYMLDPLRDFPWLRRGYEQGIEKGRKEGVETGQARAILTVLSERGIEVPENLRRQIETCADQELLDRWLRRALSAATAAEVIGDS